MDIKADLTALKEKCRKIKRKNIQNIYTHIHTCIHMYVTKRPDLVWRIKEGFPERVVFGCSYETEKHL